MKEVTLTKENFESEAMNSEKTVLIDFYADWCGPCKMIAPFVAEIAEENEDVKVCKVNVDNQPELANAFQVSSIPMLAVLKNGTVTNTCVGYRAKNQILDLLK